MCLVNSRLRSRTFKLYIFIKYIPAVWREDITVNNKSMKIDYREIATTSHPFASVALESRDRPTDGVRSRRQPDDIANTTRRTTFSTFPHSGLAFPTRFLQVSCRRKLSFWTHSRRALNLRRRGLFNLVDEIVLSIGRVLVPWPPFDPFDDRTRKFAL